MDTNKDFETLFKEICEIKLLLAEIRIEKKNLIREQRYEQAADARDRELEVIVKLKEIHKQLSDLNESIVLRKETFNQKNNLRKLINETAFIVDNYEEQLKAQTESRIKELKDTQIERIKLGVDNDERSDILRELFEKRELLALLNQLIKARPKR